MYVKAFAKINLFLDVVGKNDDGYHELEMVMLPIELHDSISISVLPYSTNNSVVCDHVELKATKYNMVNRTIALMKQTYNFNQFFTNFPFSSLRYIHTVHLHRRICCLSQPYNHHILDIFPPPVCPSS